MADENKTNEAATPVHQDGAHEEHVGDWQPPSSKLMRIYAHPWTQILLISFICFCLPGVGTRSGR